MQRKQAKISKDNPGLYIFHSESGNYHYVARETGSFLIEKRGQYQIRELEKTALNNQSIKAMFSTQQLCTSKNFITTSRNIES